MKRIALVLNRSPLSSNASLNRYVLAQARELARTGWSVECIHPDPVSGEPLGTTHSEKDGGVVFTSFAVPVRADLAARFMDEEIGRALTDYLLGRDIAVVHVHHLVGFTGSALVAMDEAGLAVCMTVHDAWFACNQCHFVRWDGEYCADGPPGPKVCAACLLERAPNLMSSYPRDAVARILAVREPFLAGALSRAGVLLAVSWPIREALLRAGLPEEKVVLSPLGIPGFEPEEPLPNMEGVPRLGFVGDIAPDKGFDVLLEAFAGLPRGSARLSVFGEVVHPDWFRMLSGLADALGVEIYGPPQPPELPGLFAGLDALVLPSRQEGCPLIVREAFHAGLPVVASALPGIEEIVDHEVNGLVVAPGDGAALTKGLARIVGEPGLLARLASNVPAIRDVAEDCEKYEKLYTMLLAQKGRSGQNAHPAP